jgi:2Fe-2S ferredoxin
VCACSTCHVYVRAGAAALSAQADDEADVLDKAFDVRPDSRLACQTRVGAADVAVEISPESRQAYLDEHPAAAPVAPPSAPAAAHPKEP